MNKDNTKQQKPFIIGGIKPGQYHHRYDLRDWIRQEFDFVEKHWLIGNDKNQTLKLEERATEILAACEQVRGIDIANKSAYGEYYREDWARITRAVGERDYDELGKALNTLVEAIEVE